MITPYLLNSPDYNFRTDPIFFVFAPSRKIPRILQKSGDKGQGIDSCDVEKNCNNKILFFKNRFRF